MVFQEYFYKYGVKLSINFEKRKYIEFLQEES